MQINNLYNETREIMNKYNITAKKKLGQNFLINQEIVDKIIEKSNINKNDLIIEIGPGLGTLTKQLIEKAGKVICIELDKKMINILQERFDTYNNIEIINQDILKINLAKIITENKNNKNLKEVKIVANLPYYITTPIIMKLLEERLDIQEIIIMIQKEVAQRLITKPGTQNAGAITYAIHYYTIPESIIEVKKESFFPIPKVNSEVIKLKVLKEPLIKTENEKLLFKIIKLSFMQRRKTLINALSKNEILEKSQIEECLQKNQIDLKIRGEKLTLEEFEKISGYINKLQ